MIAHQFGHTAVFELLMQRSPAWLRLINAAEVGDGVYCRRILADHPQLFQKLSAMLHGASSERPYATTPVLWNCCSSRAGHPTRPWKQPDCAALCRLARQSGYGSRFLTHNAPIHVFETEHGGSPLAWALHGSLHSWERAKGDHPGVARALLGAGAQVPKPDGPLEATEEVLAVIQQHSS